MVDPTKTSSPDLRNWNSLTVNKNDKIVHVFSVTEWIPDVPEFDDAVLDVDVPEGGGAVVDVRSPGVGQVVWCRQQPVGSDDRVLPERLANPLRQVHVACGGGGGGGGGLDVEESVYPTLSIFLTQTCHDHDWDWHCDIHFIRKNLVREWSSQFWHFPQNFCFNIRI